MDIIENVFDIKYEPLAGSSLINIFRLLSQNNFQVTPRYLPRFLYACMLSSILSPFRVSEHFKTHKKITHTKIEKDPIFIIGHWRSGTTYLHNVLSLDDQYGCCSTFHATIPGLFLTREETFKPILQASIPETRPMDDVKMGPDLPQEEEYAIANITPYGFYNGWCFPKNIERYTEYISFFNSTSSVKDEWKQTYLYFIKKLTCYHQGKQLLLKNPAHTARIELLLDMFPNAKFIHIYRNPYDVFYSMMKFMRIVLPRYCVQAPPSVDMMKNHIFSIYKSLYASYFKQKNLISSDAIVEVRYENFISDPLSETKKIFETLHLSNYTDLEKKLLAYIASQKSFRTSNYNMSTELKNRISDEFAFAFDAFQYSR
jgi:omega-hydroxy-beta-dihydromenaquinone-9 sulfotransferase